MRHFRCKCGKQVAHSSGGVPRCQVCSSCCSTLAEGPDQHSDPEPHQFETRVRKHEGEDLEVWEECKRCYHRREVSAQKKEDVVAMMLDDFTTFEGTIK